MKGSTAISEVVTFSQHRKKLFRKKTHVPHLEHPPRVSQPEILVIRASNINPAVWSAEEDDEEDSPLAVISSSSFLYGLCPMVLLQISVVVQALKDRND